MSRPTVCPCGTPLVQRATGRPRLYCSKACSHRAYRRRNPDVSRPAGRCGRCGERPRMRLTSGRIHAWCRLCNAAALRARREAVA